MRRLTPPAVATNMLPMRSTIMREARWLLGNVAILLAWLFALALAEAAVLLAASSDGSIAPGWAGDPIKQVFGSASLATWFMALYSPLLLIVFVPYRLLARALGHPRGIALGLAVAVTVLFGVVVQSADPGWIAVLGFFSIGYALLTRLPGQTLDSLPPLARGALVGFGLSCIWIVGSLAAIAWGGYRASRGAQPEAGAILLAGTAVPGLMLLADLFRDGVPGLNYVVTAVLMAGLAAGVLMLLRAARTREAVTA